MIFQADSREQKTKLYSHHSAKSSVAHDFFLGGGGGSLHGSRIFFPGGGSKGHLGVCCRGGVPMPIFGNFTMKFKH